ncbi:VOC family protein [Pseudooceanicola nanhaiensis]|uniref:VOC family protein n=1 Tax=Pseudooceanicola nanhaiensis TaxID=375761 RepID=UPI001CD2949D|nr:VOC family protein [Pseudooceanicola nanhaiensis]MCA0920397.1 VOC family protein [Pseudooceanicola nanhaiensis]
MPVQRVTLITLGVADLARSRAFYADLGWQPVAAQEGVCFYQMDGMGLGLFGREALAEDQGRAGTRLETGAITLAQNFSDRHGVDAAYAAAMTAGAEPLKAPEEVFWGGYSGYYADPDGHVWEVAHNPFWPLDGQGRLTIPSDGGAPDESMEEDS